MCTTSESITDLASALAKAQGQIKGAAKDAVNPHFKAQYADLASVWDACRVPLSSNGLSVVQGVSAVERGVKVTTILMHASGQWIRSELDVPAMKLDAQGLGSATTYGRRYALAAMVGVAPEDDDGNAAVGPPRQERRREQAPPKEQTDTRKMAKDYEGAMSPEELEQFVTSRNVFTERISKADSLMTLDEIAADLKTSHERIKGVVRPLWAARKKVLQGEQLPPDAGEENP